MDFRQLLYFVTAVEEGSISAAARKLFLSQPPVTAQIKALEEELGRPLLVRSGKGVQPTAFGRAVLEYAMIMRKAAEKLGLKFRLTINGQTLLSTQKNYRRIRHATVHVRSVFPAEHQNRLLYPRVPAQQPLFPRCAFAG